MTEIPPSEESPVYGKVQHQAGRLFMITCDEGWRSTILCDSMYEDDADWLLVILGRQPRRITPEPQACAGSCRASDAAETILRDNVRLRGLIGELLDSTGLDGDERARWLEMNGLDDDETEDE